MVLFSSKFFINYQHFDAKDLRNKNQIEIDAKFDDIGISLKSDNREDLLMKKSFDYAEE